MKFNVTHDQVTLAELTLRTGVSVCTPPNTHRLKPFVAVFWATRARKKSEIAVRERVIPTGFTHLVFKLGNTPQRLFIDDGDSAEYSVGMSFVGGARAAPYDKAVIDDGDSVGVLMRPGAMEALTGVPGRALAGVHTPLEDVWGRQKVNETWEQLAAAVSLQERIQILEDTLARNIPRVRGIHPLVARALSMVEAGANIADMVSVAGCSHRHLSNTFQDAVGLSPKRYCRVRRLSRALALQSTDLGWADIAAQAGYADQPHLHREFCALAGLTPGQIQRLAPSSPWHVRL